MNLRGSRQDFITSIRFLSDCLYQHWNQKVIVLIDEYDVPLENAYFEGFYNEMIGFIRSIFESALKTNPYLEFAVVTGCLRITRVLQDHEYLPIGGSTPVKVDVRIIAATNKNLQGMVKSGQFREDLFYRLNVVEIYIPPLRKRTEDIPELANQFLLEFNEKYHQSKSLDQSALLTLTRYQWKGNVRELRHMIERLVVTVDSRVITASHFPKNMMSSAPGVSAAPAVESYDKCMELFEKELVMEAYEKCGSSRKLAACLNISQTKASRLIRKHLDTPDLPQ